jgi:hypothetical protein
VHSQVWLKDAEHFILTAMNGLGLVTGVLKIILLDMPLSYYQMELTIEVSVIKGI